MIFTRITLAALLAAGLVGCTTSEGDGLIARGGSLAEIGRDLNRGERLVAEGREEVADGQDKIAKGEALISSARRRQLEQ